MADIEALLREREGYVTRGLQDRVDQVDAVLEQMGVEFEEEDDDPGVETPEDEPNPAIETPEGRGRGRGRSR